MNEIRKKDELSIEHLIQNVWIVKKYADKFLPQGKMERVLDYPKSHDESFAILIRHQSSPFCIFEVWQTP